MNVVTISSWLNFGRPAPPGRGSAAGRIFFGSALPQPARSVCVSLSVFFSLSLRLLDSFISSHNGLGINMATAAHACMIVRPTASYRRREQTAQILQHLLLHCALAAAQCIVIGPVCVSVCVWVDVCVCGSVTTITRNYVHRSSPNWVCR